MKNGGKTGIFLLIESINENIDAPDSVHTSRVIHKELLHLIQIINAREKSKSDKLDKVIICVETLEGMQVSNTRKDTCTDEAIKLIQADIEKLKGVPSITTYLINNSKKVFYTSSSLFIILLMIIEVWFELIVKGWSVLNFIPKIFGF